MTHQGDDCYFYFYSTCAKGDNCLFRHCEAALGSETICTLWQEGRCFRQVCKFRHMEIDKRRSEIPCYWEKQPTGCTKLNCAFRHSMPRFVEGVFFPATKGVQTKQEVSEAADEPILPQLPVNQLQQPKIPIQSNPSPQVRGVMKLEASENVPSPTHPPVVINAADDDEDDDDQFSEGEENKNTQPPTAEEQNGIRITSAKRQAVPVKKDCTLDFGIKTLEQIRQKKFMKEKVKKMDELPTDLATQTQKVEPNRENLVIEKENVRTVFRKVTVSPKKLAINEGELPFKRSLAERLGKKKVMPKETPEELPVKAEIETTLKRNLSERLGKRKILAEDGSEEVAQKVQNPRSIRERLGLPADITTAENEKPVTKTEGSGEIRVKTLDEIRKEKAAKRDLVDGNGDFIVGVAGLNKSTQASSFLEEASQIIRTVRVKTASESLLKKQGQLPEETGKNNLSKKHPEATPRKEQNPGLGKGKGKGQKVAPDEAVTKPKPLEQIRVKTLEEIRREKALRRHGNQESLATSQESEKPRNETPPTRKRLLRITKPIEAVQPEKADVEPMDVQSVDAATAQGDTRELNKSANGKESLRLQKVQVKSFEEILKEKRLRQLQEIEKPPNQTLPGEEAATNKMGCDIQAGDQNSQSAASEPRTNNQLGTEQPVVMTDGKLTTARPEVAEPPRALKVKPKLNVKPSFVKNSCPVRPNPKRKSPDSHPSSIMAVKPLNTGATDLTRQPPAGSTIAPTALPEQAEEVTSLTSQVPEKSKERNIDLAGQGKSTSISQSEIKSFSPPQVPAKARRLSSTASKSATSEDDFEELMKEFSDDKLEAEIDLDPGKDEDDLLLELSEMIDS